MTINSPTRGEVWLVRLPRAVGAELQRDRPVVVVSSPVFDKVPVRIIVPLMSWREGFSDRLNKIRIAKNDRNGLHTDSAADILQVRSASTDRFLEQIGTLEIEQLEEIVAGVVTVLDYRP